MNSYKFEPGGRQKLQEKNSKWINKDEHKFLRLASHYIERNGEGVLGFVTSHGYLSDPTLRGMRWEMLRTFDRIHVLDLHGNTNRREVSPDGTPDKNVFDILQGVAIIVAVRRKDPAKKDLAKVFHAELWGSRGKKNEALWSESIRSGDWSAVTPSAPRYLFVPKDEDLLDTFEAGIPLDRIFGVLGNGIVTKRDNLCLQESPADVWRSMVAFRDEPEATVRARYHIPEDVRDWRYEWARADVLANFDESKIQEINYRPFDSRFMLYTGNARGFVGWPVKQVMANYLRGPNIGLLSPKANRDAEFAHVFVTDRPSEAIFLSATTGSNAMNMPLYLYPDEQTDQSDAFAPEHRVLNVNAKVFSAMCEAAGINPGDQALPDEDVRAATGDSRRSEVKFFDYIYAVLYSPRYREMFSSFLKTDYPRIPFPASPEVFRRLSHQGERLRRLHLAEPAAIGDANFPFMGEGDDIVAAGFPQLDGERIYINNNQYFDAVPPAVWTFRIGGYQPARKWLKDRRGRPLNWGDIGRYQMILAILEESHQIQQVIDLGA